MSSTSATPSPTDSQPEDASSEPQIAPETPSKTAPVQKSVEDLSQEVKNRLELVIAGKKATVRFKGKALVFKRWGLRKQLQLASRVLSIVDRAQQVFSGQSAEMAPHVMLSVLGVVADDVLEIIASSIDEPFTTLTQAEAWLDENVEDLSEMFDLAMVVWEQNLKGEALGKFQEGVEKTVNKINSLSTSLSKP
jgi:hypothetical protein